MDKGACCHRHPIVRTVHKRAQRPEVDARGFAGTAGEVELIGHSFHCIHCHSRWHEG